MNEQIETNGEKGIANTDILLRNHPPGTSFTRSLTSREQREETHERVLVSKDNKSRHGTASHLFDGCFSNVSPRGDFLILG